MSSEILLSAKILTKDKNTNRILLHHSNDLLSQLLLEYIRV